MNPHSIDPSELPLPSMPNPEVVIAAYADVVGHNDKNTGLGAALFALITAIPHEEIDIDDDAEPIAVGITEHDEPAGHTLDADEDLTARGDMEGEVLNLVHDDLFMRVGVKVAPIGSYWGFGGGEGRITSVKMQPTLENGTLFREFLSTVDADDTNAVELQPLVNGLLGTIRTEVRLGFDPAATSGQELPVSVAELQSIGEDGLRKFIGIESELERLGLDESYSAQSLKDAVKYWGDGILSEFYVADVTGVMRGVNSKTFSPSEWQRDASKEFLQENWAAIVDAIKFAKANPNAGKFSQELIDRAVAHLEFAREDFKRVDVEYNSPDRDYRYGEGFVEVFDAVDLQLRELAETE